MKRLAPHTAVVLTLKKYGDSEVGFLADQLGRRPGEIKGYLQTLEREGVVQYQGSTVSLLTSKRTPDLKNTDSI